MSTVVSQSISDINMKILQSRIYDATNKDNPASKWIQGALDGKVNQLYKKMQAEWIPILMNDNSVAAVSASREDFINQVTNRSDYKDRWTKVSGSAAENSAPFV